jgi:3-oxoacyl-[acyl-carrier protein] reductase
VLRNNTALIPGASRPIGREIAHTFGKLGVTLFLPVFDWPDSIAEMKQEFSSAGYSFSIVEADLRQKEDVISLAASIESEAGHLDYLINNIERGGMPVVHGSYDLEHNKDQWEIEIETTLKAKWLLFHHCFPLMQAREGSSVVNITSVAGEMGRSGAAAFFFNDGYSAANRAVQTFTEAWAREAAPEVRVNELRLGLIQNRHGEGTKGWSLLTDSEKDTIHRQIPLARTGLPEEVAKVVYFLSVTATYMTGSVIKMDGGFSLGDLKVPPIPPGVL